MPSIACALLAFLVQTPPAPPTPKPEPKSAPQAAPTDAVQFTVGMKPGDARLIELQGSIDATVTATVGRNKVDVKQRSTASYRLVDSMVEPGASAWTGWRRFVKAQETKDGEIDDPELTGLEVDVACSKDAVLDVKLRSNRSVSKPRLRRLVAELGAFGLHVDLPSRLAPGQECDVDCTGLAQMCFDLDGVATSAKAHLKLLSVEAKTNVAHLAGDVTVEETIDESAEDSNDGVASKASGHYEGKVEIDYDLAAKRVSHVACKGKGHVEGDLVMIPPTHVAGDSIHDVTITSVEGTAVTAALKEKPKARDVPHKIEAAGIFLVLPSHFFRVHVEGDDSPRFLSVLDGEEKQFSVRVTGFEEPGHALKDETDAFGKSLAEHNPGMKITESPITSAVGAGRAYEFVNEGYHSMACLLGVTESRFATVQFIAPEAAWAAHAKECPKILQALKKLPPKK